MADVNQVLYLAKLVPSVSGSVLELRIKGHPDASSFRDHYRQNDYVGIEMDDANADLLIELANRIDGSPDDHFSLAACCSVLEHVRRPWVLADQLTRILRPGGTLFMSVPWVWGYHPCPDDYFRYSWRGIIELFPAFEWDNIFYSTNVEDEFYGAEREFDDNMAQFADTPNGRRKYLPYLQLLMLGKKKLHGTS